MPLVHISLRDQLTCAAPFPCRCNGQVSRLSSECVNIAARGSFRFIDQERLLGVVLEEWQNGKRATEQVRNENMRRRSRLLQIEG